MKLDPDLDSETESEAIALPSSYFTFLLYSVWISHFTMGLKMWKSSEKIVAVEFYSPNLIFINMGSKKKKNTHIHTEKKK